MRRVRKHLAIVLGAVMAIVLTGLPVEAQTKDPPPKRDDITEVSRVAVPDPSGVVTNETESVAPGFVPPASGESPCEWTLEVPDDLAGSGVRFNGFGGFSELTGNEVQQRRVSLNASARAYSETGRWWRRSCFDEDGIFVGPSALLPEGDAVTVEELILRSLGVLDPEVPGFTVNPPGKQLVQFRSLFWLDPGYWETERTDTQTSGRVVSSVELVPVETEWDPGDGSDPVICDGPGEVWEAGDKGETFYCKHTYRTVEGEPFTITMTVKFDIRVTATVGGAPAPGNLGPYEYLIRTDTTEVGAREIQIVARNT